MATIIKWLNNLYVLGTLLVFGTVTTLIVIGFRCGLNKSEWGTWVGSFGTFATLVGTIWIATLGDRIRRKEARDLAFVAASSLTLRLSKLERALDISRVHFEDPTSRGRARRYAEHAKLIKSAGMWSDEQILPLIPIPNHVCVHLAAIRPDIEDLLEKLIEMEANQNNGSMRQQMYEKDVRIMFQIKMILYGVSLCLTECRNFIRPIRNAAGSGT